jgi:hypothetical protein
MVSLADEDGGPNGDFLVVSAEGVWVDPPGCPVRPLACSVLDFLGSFVYFLHLDQRGPSGGPSSGLPIASGGHHFLQHFHRLREGLLIL